MSLSLDWETAAKIGVAFLFPATHQSCCGNLSGNSTHFLTKWKRGETGNIPLWDNGLSKTLMATPCCSQTWHGQRQVTQHLLKRSACVRTQERPCLRFHNLRAAVPCLILHVMMICVAYDNVKGYIHRIFTPHSFSLKPISLNKLFSLTFSLRQRQNRKKELELR